MFRLVYYLQLIRFGNLIIACSVIGLTFYLLDEKISYLTLLAINIIVSAMSLGYIINDIIDVPNDLMNNKNNLLAKEKITYQESYVIALFFLIALLFSSLYINCKAQFFLFFFILPILFLYNFYLKAKILIGNICVALMLSFVFLFSALIINENIYLVYSASLFAFFLNLIREIIKDLNDVKGDKFIKMKTLPIIWGEKKTLKLIKILIFFLCLLLFFHSYFYSINYYFLSMIILVEIPLVYSLFLLHNSATKNTIYKLTFLYKGINVTGLLVIIAMKEIF
tara:strand:- start:24 stop:866 length:843 start_codon:yes stop_codon:yes gene_type:complete